jgi:hypothetical protein
MNKIIYLLKFTRDDGKTWTVLTNEFFTGQAAAQRKANRLNKDIDGELSRYATTKVSQSWDDIAD